MSEDIIEYVVSHTGTSRRQFLVRLLAGTAFAAPVIASFAIGGSAAPARSPLDAATNVLPDCGPNTLDMGANSAPGQRYIDLGTNQYCDAGSNDLDGGSNDLPGNNDSSGSGAGIPGTK